VPLARDQRRRMAFLLDLDPDLGRLITGERIAEAREALQVAVLHLSVGSWNVSRLAQADPVHLGLLIVDGVLACDTVLEDSISTELLGVDDLVRPWHAESVRPMLRHEVRWSILADAKLALLDRRLATALGGFPEVHAALLDRSAARSERLATTKAIVQLNRVDRRLLACLWQLAERWGRVTTEGVLIPLTLSHLALANLVAARRPKSSFCLGELARSGELARRPDGTWLLTGRQPIGVSSPEALRFVPPRRRFVVPATEHRSDQLPDAGDGSA